MKNIAIVGTTEHRQDAPWGDESWEIWGLSIDLSYPRITRWYELHNLDRKREKEGDYITKLAAACEAEQFRVVIARPHEDFPKAEIFPVERVCREFGRYWTNTVSWQIGAALCEWLDEGCPAGWQLGLWGVDMATNTEYEAQRPSVEHMLGMAQGMFRGTDCKLVISNKSDLLKSRGLYGIDDSNSELSVKIFYRDKVLQDRKAMADHAYDLASQTEQMTHGALVEISRWLESGSMNGASDLLTARREELQGNLQEATKCKLNAEFQRATVLGAMENQKWVKQGL